MTLTSIGNPTYIALETFKKDGTTVNTPVWVTADKGRLYVWTDKKSWKVKRIRSNPRVRLAASDSRGKPNGEWAEGRARILNTTLALDAMHRRMVAKYGLLYRAFRLTNRLRGGLDRFVVIEIA